MTTLEAARIAITETHSVFLVKRGKQRYSFYIGRQRVIRIKQSGPAAAVRVKQAASSRLDGVVIEFSWDGSKRQLLEAVSFECGRLLTGVRATPSMAGG